MNQENSIDIAQQAYDIAYELDVKYGCCPQCVLTAIKQTTGYVTDETIKASHGLSGGGGLMGEGACGALTGGLLALGALHGRDADKLHRGRGITNFNATKQLVEKFKQEYGGISCEHLQKEFSGRTWDMWKPEEYKGFSDKRGDKCAHATGLVTRWVTEILQANKKPARK
jgi:C_GCAxxG_C_C family probable redox protein